jgi:tetratricopeptide (TPR) repeat protein
MPQRRLHSAEQRVGNSGAMSLTLILALAVLMFGAERSPAQTGEGEFERAIATFNDAQELHEQGLVKEAIALYRRALEIFRDFPEAEFQLGVALLQVEERFEAEVAFRRSIELRPDWTLPIPPLARLLVESGRTPEALALIDIGIGREPSNSALWTEKVNIALDSETSPEGLDALLSRLAKQTRGSNAPVSALLARAMLERRLGRIDSALISVGRAIQSEPGNASALRLKGDIELAGTDFLSALQTADRLIAIVASDPDAMLLKALALIGLGRNAEASAILKSIETSDSNLRKQINGLLAEAADDGATLIKLMADSPDDVGILFRACTSKGILEPTTILSSCSRLIEISPPRAPVALGARGAALLRLGRASEALVDFERVLSSQPANLSARAGRSLALFNLERWDESRIAFEALVGSSTEFPIAFFYLGIIYDRLSRSGDARLSYERFLTVADKETMAAEMERAELRLSVLRRQIKPRRD